jgi:hypothetical protein
MVIGGVVLCLLGLIFSADPWRSPRAEIVVLEGETKIIDGYVTRRVAIPLRYALAVGVLLSAAGIILSKPQP